MGWVLENVYLQMIKSLFCTLSLISISIFMHLSPLNFNSVCVVIIRAFYVSKECFGHFIINEKLDSKTDDISKPGMGKNLRKCLRVKL